MSEISIKSMWQSELVQLEAMERRLKIGSSSAKLDVQTECWCVTSYSRICGTKLNDILLCPYKRSKIINNVTIIRTIR